jgi:probable rRNA maturation factor
MKPESGPREAEPGGEDPLVQLAARRAGLLRGPLEEFAQLLRGRLCGGRPFCCRVTGDTELRRLNAEFLGKEYATDVLSFPSGSVAGSLGDLAISAGRAAAQAGEQGHSLETEVRILMLHGVLHLMGHDHEGDGGRMRRLEARWRRTLGLPAGLIERSAARRPGP